MKKTLIIATLMMFASVCFADEAKIPCNCEKTPCNCAKKAPDFKKPTKGPDFAKRHAEFEKRLKLTDEQKAKAEEIRKKGFEQMKPLIDKLKEKKAEIDAVKRSRMSGQMQQEKIAEIQKQIGAIKKEMHNLRMKNMKEFESILTKKQIKELKKMKKEGRKKFEKMHKKNGHPPFGFGPKHVPTPLPLEETK